VRAIRNDRVIAGSGDTAVVEDIRSFPRQALDDAVIADSTTTTVCPWKGTAHVSTLRVDGRENRDAAWYSPDPKPAPEQIRGRVALWRGVRVTA
jgi:uncharacterized protein (DUF427 family)